MKLLYQFVTSIVLGIGVITYAAAKNQLYTDEIGLMKVYYDAVNNNADLAAAKAQYKAKQEAVPQARAGLLPQINGGVDYGDTRTALDTPATTIKRNTQLYEVSLTQPIFRVDRWFQLQAAHATNEQARLNFAVSQQQLIYKTAQAYFDVLQAQDNLAADKAEENAYERQRDQAKARFNLGLADRTDLLQAQAAYDMARSNRITTEQSVANAFQSLVTLTDKHYDRIAGMRHNLPVKPPIPNNAKTWVDKAVQQNISLQAGLYGTEAAEETLKQKKAGHAPTVDFVASYKHGDNDALGFSNGAGKPHYGYDVDQRSVGIQLQVPIYSGGLTSSQVREAHANLTVSEQQQESLRRQVVQTTINSHRAVNADVEKVKALLLTIASSQSALKATEIGFQVGTRNIVDVLDAQRQLYDAVRNYNDARYNYILDTLTLKQAVGTLSPSDLQELEAYLNTAYNPDKDFLPANLMQATTL